MPPSRLNARVPRDLETICLKCLSKEPQARYASAAALAEDLRRFRLGEAIAARPPGRAERLARWVRRRRAQAAVVTVGTLMAAGLIGGGLRLWSEERAIERGVEDDLQEAARREQEADWSGAAIALKRARGRLSRAGRPGSANASTRPAATSTRRVASTARGPGRCHPPGPDDPRRGAIQPRSRPAFQRRPRGPGLRDGVPRGPRRDARR